MARYFATRFRRRMVAPFAGDAVPAGPQVENDPATGLGVMFRMRGRRENDPNAAPRRFQAFIEHGGGLAVTWTLTLWLASGMGTDAAVLWPYVGVPLLLVPAGQLFQSTGRTMDADIVIQCVPSAALAAAQTADLYLEESE